jgi:very-short-patch-repair endonuclease
MRSDARACRELLTEQCGVLSRRQALRLGFSEDMIAWRLRIQSWQQLHAGVYAVFTGEPPRAAVLWAAVLRSGPGSLLSHYSAAELHHLSDTASPAIHVTVPLGRHVRGTTGLVIHRSSHIETARHPSLLPPRTRIEETVIDLTQVARNAEDAFHWLCRACGSRMTTSDRLLAALAHRKKVRFRKELVSGLAVIKEGVHSNLEYRYVRGIERPHGLPVARRQAPVSIAAGRRYLDNLYPEFGVAVELDGHAAHLAQDRWRDVHRDNALTGAGIITLRYNWADVTRRACTVAVEIGTVLRSRGWTGRLHPCGPGCPARHWPS